MTSPVTLVAHEETVDWQLLHIHRDCILLLSTRSIVFALTAAEDQI